ncbi:MAG: hypothetical protein PHX57_13670 [Desulfobulbaceae bacterium]|nr:hypothetical protein [Desulfobulbaceae bacterium]
MKKIFFLLLGLALVTAYASSAAAAVSLKRLAEHPFSPPLTSVTEFQTMVEQNKSDLQDGFTRAGYPELYPEFMAQLPDAEVETIQVDPGDQFIWMLFRNKFTGRVKVLKDVTWAGDQPFEAYRFYVDSEGQRYEFLVPPICGNVTLANVGPVPAKVVPAPAPAPPPVAPAPVAPAPEPAVQLKGGPVFDIGLAQQFDPASYVFARIGYAYPLLDQLYIMGLVGGFIRFAGDDGGDAFTADALLNYHFTDRVFAGAGVGYWSDEDEVDLIVNLGYLIYERPDSFKTSLFIEGRCFADDLISSEAARLGVGVRFQF